MNPIRLSAARGAGACDVTWALSYSAASPQGIQRKPQHTLIHSDQGSQYGSDDWLRFCREHHLEPSMSRRGNCWDNAVAESFFSSLKKERIRKRIYKTRDLAKADLFDYIESVLQSIPTPRPSRWRQSRGL